MTTTTTTTTGGSRPRAGCRAGARAWLLAGASTLALASCSWSSGFDSASGGAEPQLAERGAGTPAKVARSNLAPRPTMAEPGIAWSAAVEWVQAERQAPAPAAELAAEPVSAPSTWEQGLAEPPVWTEPDAAAPDEGDGEVLQLAAAPVAGEELSEQRGGFITSLGPIDIGFDIKTFVNGTLQVRNIFNMVGDIAERVQDETGIGNGLTVRFNHDGGGFTFNPLGNNNSNNSSNNNIVNNTNTSTDTITDTTPPDITPPPVVDQTVTETQTANTTPPPAPPPNIVISEMADGHIKVVNELNGGATKIINEISGGSAHTTLINTASGLDIEHITNLVVSFSNPGDIVNSVRSGFKTNGDLGGLGNSMRSALIGAISR